MREKEFAGEPLVVAISVSESPDLRRYGLSDVHLDTVLRSSAHYPLERGYDLAYGGDLRANGFTEFLKDTAFDYRRLGDPRPRFTDYLAWPVHIRLAAQDLRDMEERFGETGRLVLLGKDGCYLTMDERAALSSREPAADEWADGLTVMRDAITADSSARVVLGGRVEGYRGRMPGVAEEALASLRAKRPLFLVGGFGGCARGIAEALGLVETWEGSLSWPGQELFSDFGVSDLNNGLSEEENRLLAKSPYLDDMILLFMTGLYRQRSRLAQEDGEPSPRNA